ncbi:fimbria/pilus periplasmic chaperone [Paraburkholderia xenovorans]|uniref:fimbrial biogenesis chaperone n=1 Tax=Paraburkholderia xenovorans TaxID=36873 RepID=UPI0038BC5CE4
MNKKLKTAIAALAFSSLLGVAQAGVVLGGTRVVFLEKEREVTVKLSNEGTAPALVQSWLDNGNMHSLPDESKVPFTLTPPLFRLDPKKSQSLRLIYTQESLPKDKESLFWLNVLDIPPRADTAGAASGANLLQLAIRSRIKVFFRPAGLTGNAADAVEKVNWKVVQKEGGGYVLEAVNPTPYYVTFGKISAQAGDKVLASDLAGMVAPQTTEHFDLGKTPPPAGADLRVDYTFIDDYGAERPGNYRQAAKP